MKQVVRTLTALAVFAGIFVVSATKPADGTAPTLGISPAEAGGKCLPDGAKCAGSQLQCCSKPCTNGVCRN